MNRFISRNRDDRPAKDKNKEMKEEDRMKVARDREERLQRSIQSTLKSLGKTVDSSHRKIDSRRSDARPISKGRPDKPNKFWADSMQKTQIPKSKIGYREDSPRATNFPDFEDFLGKGPDEDALDSSPSPIKTSASKSNSFGLSPISPNYKEDDNKSIEILQLNKDKNDDSNDMDFDDPEEKSEPQLTVNLTNLLGGGQTPDSVQNVTNRSEGEGAPRESDKSKKRASQLGRDQYGSTLFDFFKNLDYTPGVTKNQGTVRASYRSGRGSYNLYGVPGNKPGDKGKVFIQSQDGFDKDLPPVRLEDEQRDKLINNFQELERLTDQSERDVFGDDDQTVQKYEIPDTPTLNQKRGKNDIIKDNKTFWSSGVEKSNAVNVPQLNKKPHQEKQFQSEYNRLMGYEETVTPGGGMESPMQSPMQTPIESEQETSGGDVTPANKSLFQTAYTSMLTSIYGGFGGYGGPTPNGEEEGDELPPDEKQTLKVQNKPYSVPIHQLIQQEKNQRAPRALSPGDEWKKPQRLPPTRDKSPMMGLSKPNHPRFNRKPDGPPRSKSFLGSKPQEPDPFQQPTPQPMLDQQENSLQSFKSGSGSLRKPQSRMSGKRQQPVVMKLTSNDFEERKPKFNHDPYNPKPYPQKEDDMDPNMPNVIILVADNVKLIRNNAVPMLQVQLEIIQSAMNYDSDMCMLGLNDVIYIVPEYTVSEYDNIYSRICTGEEYDDFQNFFEHYSRFEYNPTNDNINLPERMGGLNKNCMIAIERDHYEPDLRGKAFINLKNVPNGHYTIFYLRIGQPISINSRLKVLGKTKNIYVNLNREKIVECNKPQLDLNHSSSRISKRETSKFKIMKAQQTKKRDNKILSLNSDGEEDNDEKEEPLQQQLDKKADQELKKLKSSEGTRDDSKEDHGLEMEFDNLSGPSKGGSGDPSIQPPPLQDSKDYYNSTQRLTEAMIQNPQFQIFAIDEEESQRTSMRESVEYRADRSEDDVYPAATPNVRTPHSDAPEDAFRNVHRNTADEYSITNNAPNLPRPSTKDEINRQIEDYQQNSLAQLASFMNSEPTPSQPSSRKSDRAPQIEEYKPPVVNEEVPPLKIAPQKSTEFYSQRRDSVKSGRSNGSNSSRTRTRVKTISLKELEQPEQPERPEKKQEAPWTPGQPRVKSPINQERQRSNSSQGGRQRKITEIQSVRPRSSSSGKKQRRSASRDDPFADEMRETIKGNPAFLHQQMSARPQSRGRSASGLSSARSNEGGGKRPWAKKDDREGQRSKSRPQSGVKPFPGIMINQQPPQTPTEKMFDRYGNPLQQQEEDMRPKSQAQPQAFDTNSSMRPPSRGQDSGRNRFFRQRSTSQGSGSSTGRRRGLSNTFLGSKQKQKPQYNENFSDDGSPARADMIQVQQERRMGRMGKR